VAVDSAGHVYITNADINNDSKNRVLKLTAGSNSPVELSFTGLKRRVGVVADSAGHVYVADFYTNRVLRLPVRQSTYESAPI
jgi:DNA-binding beta-propeller fold protein YncE